MSMKRAVSEPRLAEPEIDGAAESNAPRKMTAAENVILTIKVLAGFGLIGAALWGLTLWKSAS